MNNHPNYPLISLMLGFLLGGLFVLITANSIPSTIVYRGKTALIECEKSLPRDQHCILTAIPETQK